MAGQSPRGGTLLYANAEFMLESLEILQPSVRWEPIMTSKETD